MILKFEFFYSIFDFSTLKFRKKIVFFYIKNFVIIMLLEYHCIVYISSHLINKYNLIRVTFQLYFPFINNVYLYCDVTHILN